MDCPSNHSIFLRSNGSLVCWCDYGSLLTLQPFEETLNYGRDVYLGRVFQEIRTNLQKSIMPFPDYCTKCQGLANHVPYNASHGERKEILTFNVEPSLACNLDCPSCNPENRIKNNTPPYILEFSVLEKILIDLQKSQIHIHNIHFEGHGEPLMNKQLWQMVRFARDIYPTAKLSMGTNANGIFHQDCVSSGLDEIRFAIDGVDQSSYEPYRKGGDFSKAYAFMKNYSIEARKQSRPIKTIWKYIVFAHNDTPEQLIRAQELALEAGVSELDFVLTQLGPKSTKITDYSQIPCINNGVMMNTHNFQADLNSIRQSVEFARTALTHDDYESAQKNIIYGATMLSRRFTQADEISEANQEIILDLLELSERLSYSNLGETAFIGKLKELAQKRPRYEATMAEGIDFKKLGYPSFILRVSGMSVCENWGRWSDATKCNEVTFRFLHPLPEAFNLELCVMAYGPNVGKPVKIILGNTETSFVLKTRVVERHVLTFERIIDVDTIKIVPPEPTRPCDFDATNLDSRRLGLGFVSLKICPISEHIS